MEEPDRTPLDYQRTIPKLETNRFTRILRITFVYAIWLIAAWVVVVIVLIARAYLSFNLHRSTR